MLEKMYPVNKKKHYVDALYRCAEMDKKKNSAAIDNTCGDNKLTWHFCSLRILLYERARTTSDASHCEAVFKLTLTNLSRQPETLVDDCTETQERRYTRARHKKHEGTSRDGSTLTNFVHEWRQEKKNASDNDQAPHNKARKQFSEIRWRIEW